MVSYYKVIPDTSFLFLPFEVGLDIEDEISKVLSVKYEIVVPECVLHELKRIINDPKESRKKRRIANLIYEYVNKKFKILKNLKGNVDDVLMNIALKDKNVIICTNDKELRKRLKKFGVPIIYLHDYKIEIDGYIK